MITDESGRFVVTQLDEHSMWHYDRRWRSASVKSLEGEPRFALLEGAHHFAAVAQSDGRGEIEVTVRSAARPDEAIATGRYGGSWWFEGDAQAWTKVPEYLLVHGGEEHLRLLRIADDAEPVALPGLDGALAVVDVPGSRLVVITSPGAFTVFDPVAGLAVRHYDLAGANPAPMVRFRSAGEMWIDDGDSMVKVDARTFEVLDAAGSDIGETGEGVPRELGHVGRWTFAGGNELCVVTRPSVGDVLVLDTVSMLPVARGVFGRYSPIDAVMTGRNTVIAVDSGGRPLRCRLRRVSVRVAPPDPAPTDRQPGPS